MKTRLTLSALLISTMLAPAAFANPAALAKADAEANTAPSPAAVVTSTSKEANDVNRTVMQRLDLDVRQEVLGSLRSGLAEVLQLAAPILVEVGIQQLDLSDR
jgi:hypothetical protein